MSQIDLKIRDLIQRLAEELEYSTDHHYQQELKAEARAYLATPEPAAPTDQPKPPTDEDLLDLADDLGLDRFEGEYQVWGYQLLAYARAVYQLGRQPLQPEPAAGPTDEELDLLVTAIQALPGSRHPETHALDSINRGRTMIRRALARWGNHAPQPIPISERLPGKDACCNHPRTGKGHWCWGLERNTYSYGMPIKWRFMTRKAIADESVAWLPHWAISVPQKEL